MGRSTLILIFLLLTGSYLAHAQKAESVLWRISGNGLPKNSYLFGTYHTASQELINKNPKLKKLIKKCDFGLLEKGLNAIGNVPDTAIITPPLDKVFSKDEYALVDSFFTNSPFGSIRPHNNDASLQAMAQAVLMLKQTETGNQEMFFDEYIYQLMEDQGKPIFGLDEPVEMALNAAKQDHELLAKAIITLIKNDIKPEDLASGNYFDAALYNKALMNNMRLEEEVKEEWFKEGTVKRNLIWLPKIITKMHEGACFIAVGLGHLKFQSGLIILLKKEGYRLHSVRAVD